MDVKEAFSFLIILFHPFKLCVVYVYIIFLMVCLLQILNKTLTIIQGKMKSTFLLWKRKAIERTCSDSFSKMEVVPPEMLEKEGRACKIKLDVDWSRERGWNLDSLDHKVWYLGKLCHKWSNGAFMNMLSIPNPLSISYLIPLLRKFWNLLRPCLLVVPLYQAAQGKMHWGSEFPISHILQMAYDSLNPPTQLQNIGLKSPKGKWVLSETGPSMNDNSAWNQPHQWSHFYLFLVWKFQNCQHYRYYKLVYLGASSISCGGLPP